jgi:hypothetical protein
MKNLLPATALTGAEAISNRLPAFRKPKSRNAAVTLWGSNIGILCLTCGLRCSIRSCCDLVLVGESVEDRSAAHLMVGNVDHWWWLGLRPELVGVARVCGVAVRC